MKLIQRLITTLLVVLLVCPQSFATISSAIVFEVENGASDTNGGGYKTGAVGGTDWSMQTTPHATLTVLSVVGATTTRITVSPTDYTVASTDVGNLVRITGGTATAGLYEITGGTTGAGQFWTLDRSAGTAGQTVVGFMGGADATPGRAAADATVSGQQIWVKYNASDYTISTATPGSGGPVLFGSSIAVSMLGYETTRGDAGNRPTLNWGAVAAPGGLTYLYACQGTAAQAFINLRANGNSVNNVGGFNGLASGNSIVKSRAVLCNGTAGIGINLATGAIASNSSATTCTTGIVSAGAINDCSFFGNGVGGTFSSGSIANTLFYGNTGDGGTVTGQGTTFNQDTFSGNGGDGLETAGNRSTVSNSVSTFNSGYGYNASSATVLRLLNSFSLTNTLGRTNSNPLTEWLPATNLSVDPYVDKSTNDFRPNNTAGGGALLRGFSLGVPGQTNNQDAGAVQSSAPTTLIYSRVRKGSL